MPNKKELFDSLEPDTVFTEAIYKRIYGYSVTDPEYLPRVAEKLAQIGRKDAIQGYNEWFQEWKAADDAMRKEVSEWYLKECQKAREKRGEGKRVLQEKPELQRDGRETWIKMAKDLGFQQIKKGM